MPTKSNVHVQCAVLRIRHILLRVYMCMQMRVFYCCPQRVSLSPVGVHAAVLGVVLIAVTLSRRREDRSVSRRVGGRGRKTKHRRTRTGTRTGTGTGTRSTERPFGYFTSKLDVGHPPLSFTGEYLLSSTKTIDPSPCQ